LGKLQVKDLKQEGAIPRAVRN